MTYKEEQHERNLLLYLYLILQIVTLIAAFTLLLSIEIFLFYVSITKLPTGYITGWIVSATIIILVGRYAAFDKHIALDSVMMLGAITLLILAAGFIGATLNLPIITNQQFIY